MKQNGRQDVEEFNAF